MRDQHAKKAAQRNKRTVAQRKFRRQQQLAAELWEAIKLGARQALNRRDAQYAIDALMDGAEVLRRTDMIDFGRPRMSARSGHRKKVRVTKSPGQDERKHRANWSAASSAPRKVLSGARTIGFTSATARCRFRPWCARPLPWKRDTDHGVSSAFVFRIE